VKSAKTILAAVCVVAASLCSAFASAQIEPDPSAGGTKAISWTVTEARGLPQNIQLKDLKGKWVVVDFWFYSCHACVERMVSMIDFYKKHHDQHDQFEIIAFHNDLAKNLAEVDDKIKPLVDGLWGEPLPFPILLDASGKTQKAWGISAYPSTYLFDPNGKIVAVGDQVMPRLRKELVALKSKG
jgi:cytochrome oxidase Cu insertion factor (SCO1/SenC/PrrC family)